MGGSAGGTGPTWWARLRALRLVPGFLLSLMPLLLWVALVVVHHRGAVELWYREMVLRATGRGEHNQPVWYFVPIFLVGLFPATAMLSLPGINLRFRAAWGALRDGTASALWALAVALPFVMFSLIRGKLASYLLPLCVPMALLSAGVLDGWLSRRHDTPPPGERPSDVRLSLLIVFGVLAGAAVLVFWSPASWVTWALEQVEALSHRPMARVGATLAFLRATLGWLPVALLAPALAAGWMAWWWKRRPGLRGSALAAVWCALAGLWLAGWDLEDTLVNATGTPALLERVRAVTGLNQPRIVTYGYTDTNLPFYTHHRTPVDQRADLLADLAEHGEALVVVAEVSDWERLRRADGGLAALFEVVAPWPDQSTPLGAPRWVLRPRPGVVVPPAARSD